MNPDTHTLRGEIKNVTFANEENGFAVLRLLCKRRNRTVEIMAKGTIYQPYPGEIVALHGHWEHHQTYGRQFAFSSFTRTVPASKQGMIKYLSSRLIKGIGKVYAEKIVHAFGEATFDTIEHHPEALKQIRGIGEKRIRQLAKAWQEQTVAREVMLFLSSHDINLNYAVKIVKTFGQQAIEVLKENPYLLAEKIRGIGFKTADRIARKLNIAPDSPNRLQAGLTFLVFQAADNGHTMAPKEELIENAAKEMEVPAARIAETVHRLVEHNRLFALEKEGRIFVSLPVYYYAERLISERLLALMQSRQPIAISKISAALDWVQQRMDITLSAEQRAAVSQVIAHKVCLITGGPGTGKTTIVHAIYKIFNAKKARIALLSPTGKASKRLSQVVGAPASTIHRMLGYKPTGGFSRNEQNPLPADMIIVDEFSMVDTQLFAGLLRALPDAAHLVLIGDADQLPSVGAGDVLHHLIRSAFIPCARLEHIFRQKRRSLIVQAAHRIRKGQFPFLPDYQVSRSHDLYFLDAPEKDAIPSTIIKIMAYDVPRISGHKELADIQVLSAMNRGVAGVHNLNTCLQDYFNKHPLAVKRFGQTFKPGDKVMQTANNYDKQVFNGDSGIISAIDAESRLLTVTFSSRRVEYRFDELDELALAYAISIHKSQGSEFPVVIMPMITSHYIMLKRNLLYTGLTRAKRLAVILGSKKALAIAIHKQDDSTRWSYLEERLKQNRAFFS